MRDLKSRFDQKAIALGLVSPFNTFHYIHTKVRLRAVSYFFLSHSGPIAQSTRERRGANGQAARNEGDLTFLLAVRGSEERRTTARGLQKSAFQGSTS